MQGLEELRLAIKKDLNNSNNNQFEAEDIIIGPGTKELMFLTQIAFNGEIILPAPSCVSYLPLALIAKNKVLWIQTISDTNWFPTAQQIENKVKVGPYARIRPGTHLMSGVKIGNFVETKKSKIKSNSKVNHLSYIGDTLIGKNSNIGAGTITCNYDGIKKNKTTISDNVFIGSNTSLVAPIKIGKKSIVGAGSVITRDVKENSLALERSEQEEIENYKRKK